MVRQYAATQFVTSRMLLVVVGNVSRAHLDALVTATLGTLPAGQYMRTAPPDLPSRRTSVVSVSRPTATSYIVGWYGGPPFASKDYPAFELATSYLSSRLNHSIRQKENLSYAAYATADPRAIASGGMYVSTGDPKTVIPMMQRIVDSLKLSAVEYQSWYLGDFTKEFRGGFLMENETNEGQAAALARAQIMLGDYHRAAEELQRYRGVNLGDIVAAARRYMHDLQFAYVGDTSHFRADWVRR
jgi:zinc protease